MKQETPIGRADVRAAVLPARAAYLVPAGDRKAFGVAICEASTRWAGVTEPIVPVRADGRVDGWWSQVVKLSKVDGLVNVNLSSALAEQVASRLGLPVVDIAHIDHEGATRFSTHPRWLAPDKPPGDGDSWVMAAEDASLWQLVAAGGYYPHRVDELSGIEILRPPKETAFIEVGRAQICGSTWLDAGVRDIAPHQMIGGPGAIPMALWVTKPASLRECTYFWNLRALRPFDFSHSPMALLTAGSDSDWGQLGQVLTPHLQRPDELEPDVVLCSLNASEAELDDLATSLGLVRSTADPYSRFSFPPPPLRQAPYTYRLNPDLRGFVLFEREYGRTAGTTVQVYREDTRIEFDSPVSFSGSGSVMLRLESELFAGLPQRPTVASMIRDGATWWGDKLQIATNATDRYRLDVRIPSLQDAAWELIHSRCHRVELSDKGRMAQRLLELGGYEVLLKREVRLAVETLKTARSEQLARQLTRISSDGHPTEELLDWASRLGETQQRRFQSVQQLKSAGIPSAECAELLCHQGWAERGLCIACERCGVRSFVPLEQTQPDATCPACQAPQLYEVDPRSGAPLIQYRLHGLIDRAADQGVLSHLLAIAALCSKHEHTFLIPGANIQFVDGTEREVDLFGIVDGTVVAGEAKTSPTGFDESDIEADVELSSALGADAHLMIAAEPMTEETIKRAKQHTRNAKLGLIFIQGENVETSEHID